MEVDSSGKKRQAEIVSDLIEALADKRQMIEMPYSIEELSEPFFIQPKDEKCGGSIQWIGHQRSCCGFECGFGSFSAS